MEVNVMLEKPQLFPKKDERLIENNRAGKTMDKGALSGGKKSISPYLHNGILYDGAIEETDIYVRRWTKDGLKGIIEWKKPMRGLSDLLF